MRPPDAGFAETALAEIYDVFDRDRDTADLDEYVAILDEFKAQRILDIGCGTGTLACMLAARGKWVAGLDPALASIDVARGKPNAELVQWIHGDMSIFAGTQPGVFVAPQPGVVAGPQAGVVAGPQSGTVLRHQPSTVLSPHPVGADWGSTGLFDAAVMTGNVGQVFVDEGDWRTTLLGAARVVRPGGLLCFEVRNPARRAWESWTKDETYVRLVVPGKGAVQSWVELTEVELPLVSFRGYYVFENDGRTAISDSTLRFREKEQIAKDLAEAGFLVEEIRDAPDRPGREWVFLATRTGVATEPG